MIPSFIIPVAVFPLNPSGKTDRKALAAIEPVLSGHQEGTVRQPETEIEAMVLAVWEKQLQFEGISTTDNFFDLGGNSILAVRVHGELDRLYPGRLTVADLFIHSSVQQIAAALTVTTESEKSYLCPVVLPEMFFARNDQPSTFVFQIDGELFELLNQIAKGTGIGCQAIFLASFAYLLHEISGQAEVGFIMMTPDASLQCCSVDFDAIDSPQDLLNKASEFMAKGGVPLAADAMDQAGINPASSGSLSMLSFSDTFSSEGIDTDIYFAPVFGRSQIECSFRAGARIKKSSAREMITTLTQVLHSITGSFEIYE
jgi:hypothetical protein